MELEILKVGRRLALLRCSIGLVVREQELLDKIAIAKRQLVPGGLLERLARLLERCRTLAARSELPQIEQLLGSRLFGQEIEEIADCHTCFLGCAAVSE